jgi:hypothetical protein
MTNSALVLHKASRVRGRLLRVRDGLTVGRDAFAGETGRIEQVAFNIFLAMQECLDLASHIVSDQDGARRRRWRRRLTCSSSMAS